MNITWCHLQISIFTTSFVALNIVLDCQSADPFGDQSHCLLEWCVFVSCEWSVLLLVGGLYCFSLEDYSAARGWSILLLMDGLYCYLWVSVLLFVGVCFVARWWRLLLLVCTLYGYLCDVYYVTRKVPCHLWTIPRE